MQRLIMVVGFMVRFWLSLLVDIEVIKRNPEKIACFVSEEWEQLIPASPNCINKVVLGGLVHGDIAQDLTWTTYYPILCSFILVRYSYSQSSSNTTQHHLATGEKV
jgi:hypothetical protein